MAVAALLRALAPYGLDLIGTTTTAAYDALVPAGYRFAPAEQRAVIVIGNGGAGFWSAYQRHVASHPEHATCAHPIDEFTAEVMESVAVPVAEDLGLRPSLRLPFRATAPPLSFVHLAEAAGLGRRSLLGVLVHPEYGPWMALRGALLVDAVPPAARPAAGFEPCDSCLERPCLAACPAGAVRHPEGWDVPACIEFRVAAGDANPCRDRCHARTACVYGRRHRYPDDALAYHQRRAFAVMAGR